MIQPYTCTHANTHTRTHTPEAAGAASALGRGVSGSQMLQTSSTHCHVAEKHVTCSKEVLVSAESGSSVFWGGGFKTAL